MDFELPILESPPARAARSPVPDLLFEDIREKRVVDLIPMASDPYRVHAGTPLHRMTVFLTYRCNLDCPYCKTIVRSPNELAARPQRGKTYDLAAFQQMLESHGDTPIEHLHFTGGEASIVNDLPEMLRFARKRGVGRTSITSNGTQKIETYLQLVEAGIDEIRISIDASDAEAGLSHTGRSGAWDRCVAAIRALAEARRNGAEFFLILNTVVTKANRARLDETVRFLAGLGPDDLKLITEVDVKGELADFPERNRVIAGIEEVLALLPPDRFPLLRMKLSTVFAPTAIGLEQERAPQGRDWR